MRRILASAGIAAITLMTLLMVAGPAGAAEATGCKGTGTSFDDKGKQLDTGAAPGQGGTDSDPFEMDVDGRVEYTYDGVDSGIAGGTWDVKILNSPIPAFGGDISPTAQLPSGDGVEPMKEHFQFGGLAPLLGKYKIEITASGGGAECVVKGVIQINGSLVKSPTFYVSLVFVGAGALLFLGAMGRPV
jgi:hypothetical protein